MRTTGDHLPAVTDKFTGRDEDVKRVLEELSRDRVTTVTGLGGIGKSELAKTIGHAACGQEWTSEGVYYLDLQGTTDVNAVMSAIITGMGFQSAADAIALAQRLRGYRLYVLDDLYQALVKDHKRIQALVRALHDYAEPARFLLTSCEPVGLPDLENTYSLDRLLPPHDADLFRKLAATSYYEWHEGDDGRLVALLRDLDGYPLAITIVANLLYGSSLQAVLSQWEKRHAAALKVPGINVNDLGRLTSVDFSLALSYDNLPAGDARLLFALFADLPAGATSEMLEAMMGEGAHDAINLLVRRALAQKRGERYGMLVPVRELAARFLAGACKPFRQKLDAYLLTLAEQWCGDDRVWVSRPYQVARLLATELLNLHAAMDRAKARSDTCFLVNLTKALCRFYAFALSGAEAVQRLQESATAAHTVGDRLAQATCIRHLGNVYYTFAEYEPARQQYDHALSIYHSLDDRLGEAHCIMSPGRTHLNTF